MCVVSGSEVSDSEASECVVSGRVVSNSVVSECECGKRQRCEWQCAER